MYKIIIILIFITLILLNVTFTENGSAFKDVKIEQGLVRGYKNSNKRYYEFLGIPYAAAPVKENRFKAPLPPPKWIGVFHSNKTVLCPQYDEEDEDCLVINVFVPSHRQNELLPVLVQIHGGAFIIGGGIWNTDGIIDYRYFTDKNIIVVTFNYRLGALGFLCLRTDEVPGNAGMKDQIAALKWVKNFIEPFGGDRNYITLCGTSAGGTSVELLMLSPLSKGLFKNAIVESGSATTVWAIDPKPVDTAERVAKDMGYTETNFNVTKLGDFYRSANIKKLNRYTYLDFDRRTDGTFGFVPCLEKSSRNAFLSEDPWTMIHEGNFQHLPLLYIFVNGEGFFRESHFFNYKKKMNENFSEFLPANLYFKNDSIKHEISNRVKTFYFQNNPISNETAKGFILTQFIYPLVSSAKKVAGISSKNVYLLEFTYEGGLSYKKKIFGHVPGAAHTDSYSHVFVHNQMTNGADGHVVEIMINIWTNFIKYGSPKIPNWLPLKPHFTMYLQMDQDLKYNYGVPHQDRIDIWEKVYKSYRKKTNCSFV